MQTKQYATNNQLITEETKDKIKKIPRNKWQQKHDDPKCMGCSKSSSKFPPQGTRKISNKQPKLTPKTTSEKINKQITTMKK